MVSIHNNVTQHGAILEDVAVLFWCDCSAIGPTEYVDLIQVASEKRPSNATQITLKDRSKPDCSSVNLASRPHSHLSDL